jgi:hypothetical protein
MIKDRLAFQRGPTSSTRCQNNRLAIASQKKGKEKEIQLFYHTVHEN